MTTDHASTVSTWVNGRAGAALALALVCGLTWSAAAQTAPKPQTKPRPAVARMDEGGPGQRVALTLTKARQFTLPADVRDVLVADPAVADVLIKTPRLAYMIGNKVGDTNAIFLDAAGRQVLKLDIRVDRDLSALRAAIAELVPDADVKVAPLNQDLVVSGDVPSSQSADRVRALVRHFVDKDENLVNMLKVTGSQQVLIRIKVAEVRRAVTKQLGFDLFMQGKAFSLASGAPVSGLFPLRFGSGSTVGSSLGAWAAPFFVPPDSRPIGAVGAPTGNWATSPSPNSFTGPAGVTTGPANFGTQIGGSPMSGTIEALEQQGMIKVLAEPNLTAVSGEPATFLAGGEFPVPTGRDQYGNITIEWKSFGVSLNFTPVVLSSGNVSLRIGTEVSELSNEGQLVLSGVTIPALAVRRAQTTLEMPSGGSMMLGGLLRNNARNTVRGLPGLKDLPVLGALFRSDDFLSDESEMVVIATPYVVRAGTPAAMKAPTDGFAPASDLDMYLLNGLYARYGGGSKAAGTKPDQPAPAKPLGYIMP